MRMQRSFGPCLETLESRELPAGLQAYVSQANLCIVGTNNSDFILVTEANNQFSVLGTQIALNNGHANTVSASSISQILIYGYNGNDFIDLAGVKTNATIYEGNGNDYITCGSGNDVISAGSGFNEIFRPYNASQPTGGTASASQIDQGQNPLCQTDAALADLAQAGYSFANNIKYLGGDMYQVTLHGLPTQQVFFDGWTNNNDPVEPSSRRLLDGADAASPPASTRHQPHRAVHAIAMGRVQHQDRRAALFRRLGNLTPSPATARFTRRSPRPARRKGSRPSWRRATSSSPKARPATPRRARSASSSITLTPSRRSTIRTACGRCGSTIPGAWTANRA